MEAKKVLEKEVRKQVVDHLRGEGWFVFYHLQGMGSFPGLSDLQAVKDGRTIYIECKTMTGRQSPKQKIFQEQLEAHGGVYILARCVEDVFEVQPPAQLNFIAASAGSGSC